jgi:tetratricopeptide (TPR) repeat protein
MTCKGNEIHQGDEGIHAKWVFPKMPKLCNARSMCGSEDNRTVKELKESAESALMRGDSQRAAQLLDAALAALDSSGEKNPLRAQIAVTRADLYWDMGDLQKAAGMYEEVLSWLESEYGTESEVVAICLRNLSEISQEQGDTVRAKFYNRRWREIIGPLTE